ncbi:hypothetical protein BD410DRAFT_836544 [Rickenella mellea]|uniref:Mid2 domain-containing protein n=1 Tax=Rickenella mellea TaxID=50990 RepID=A0A4Y7QGD3_9AGAM|nr:hypothetical protein BD410DRAFT_836544 [Rickenella mellea]
MPGASNLFAVILFSFLAWRLDYVTAGGNQMAQWNDPRINYVGTWVDQSAEGHKFTTSSGASLSFTFQGTAVYYHTMLNARGALANFWVDNDPPASLDSSSGTTAGNFNAQPVVLFSKTNLDPSKSHTLNVAYQGSGGLGGAYLEIYYIEFTPADPANNQPPAQQPNNNPNSIGNNVNSNSINNNTPAKTNAVVSQTAIVVTENGQVITMGTAAVAPSVTPTIVGAQPSVSVVNATGSPSTIVLVSVQSGATVFGSADHTIVSGASTPTSPNGGVVATNRHSNSSVIGGVIGGAFTFLVIMIILVVFLCRRRRAKNERDAVTPFPGRISGDIRRSLGGRAVDLARKMAVPPPRGLDLTARRETERSYNEISGTRDGAGYLGQGATFASSSSEKATFSGSYPTPPSTSQTSPALSTVMSIFPTQRGTTHRRGTSQRGLTETRVGSDHEMGTIEPVAPAARPEPLISAWDDFSGTGVSDPPPQYNP